MAKIYSGIEGITKPEFQADWRKYDQLQQEYVDNVKKWAKTHYPSPAGEEIYFPVGDGSARYVVLSLKPVALVHLDVGDGWQFQYANRLTAKDVKDEIKRQQTLRELFGVLTARNGI